MLTTIDFDDHARFKANEVEYKALKRDRPTKFEARPALRATRSHEGEGIKQPDNDEK